MNIKQFPPEWFNLENYTAKTRCMTAIEWAGALKKRFLLWTALGTGELFAGGPNVYDESIAPMLLELLKFASELEENNGESIAGILDTALSIRSVDVGMIGSIWNNLSGHQQLAPFLDNILKGSDQGLDDEQMEIYEKFFNTPIDLLEDDRDNYLMEYVGKTAYAEIDLDASDEKLLDDFKRWLAMHRKCLKVPTHKTNISDSDFKEWHEKMVIPYLDLIIYARLSKLNPSQQQLGLLLFPNQFDINLADRIRRTVKPLAELVVSRATVRALDHQTYHYLSLEPLYPTGS